MNIFHAAEVALLTTFLIIISIKLQFLTARLKISCESMLKYIHSVRRDYRWCSGSTEDFISEDLSLNPTGTLAILTEIFRVFPGSSRLITNINSVSPRPPPSKSHPTYFSLVILLLDTMLCNSIVKCNTRNHTNFGVSSVSSILIAFILRRSVDG
jgi:hypothetical protein